MLRILALLLFVSLPSLGQSFVEILEQSHNQALEQTRDKLPSLRDPFRIPPKVNIMVEDPEKWNVIHRWRRNVVATIFWVGEDASQNNPVHNHASSWDPNWLRTFGGIDDPENRNGYFPRGFYPQQNPFYIALPYNDIAPGGGRHKDTASEVVPWYWRSFRSPGSSVCHGRWIALHFGKKVCYAQWRDVGPFSTDDWEYVFQGKPPKPNRNGNAGIDLSPAVRDFLGIKSGQTLSWKFVDSLEVIDGPWSEWLLPTK